MRKLCPKCNGYSLAYDGRRKVERCYSYTCDYVAPKKTTCIQINREFEEKKKFRS